MDSGSMGAVVNSLVAANLRVVRFEFEYMASRRKSATKKPPPRAETLKSEYVSAIDVLKAKSPIVIGGKSMGGRVASMIADELYSSKQIAAYCASAIHSTRSGSLISSEPHISPTSSRRH